MTTSNALVEWMPYPNFDYAPQVTEVAPDEQPAIAGETLAALIAPFRTGEAVNRLITLKNFTVTVDLEASYYQVHLFTYRLYAFVYTIGNPQKYAPQTHQPVFGKLLKTRLHRLTPHYQGATLEGDNAASFFCSLPESVPVARLHVVARGLTDPAVFFAPDKYAS